MTKDEQIKNIGNYLIKLFDASLKEEEKWVSRMAKTKLSISEIHTLVAISEAENAAMTAVAQRLRITISTLTIAVNKLEEKGFVKKVRDTEDKRIIKVQLTEEGQYIAKKHDRVQAHMINRVVEDLNTQEIEILEKTLEKMLLYITKKR